MKKKIENIQPSVNPGKPKNKQRKRVAEISDSYVAQVMKISLEILKTHPDIIECKRLTLKIKRQLKENEKQDSQNKN